ncbi:MAG: DUF1801 domain-containing protein [Eubacteriales bacterium]|nr:DUF1801 domain-containing protein [Eubacteriales bacterium]
MWECPKCGREFVSAAQEHDCGEPLKTIDAYIAAQPEPVRPLLNQVRRTIHDALPDAQERISWGMPTYWSKRNIVHFAAFQKHIGLYPGAEAIENFRDRLKEYATSKGAVRFPYGEPLPLKLIEEIAKWCYETYRHR